MATSTSFCVIAAQIKEFVVEFLYQDKFANVRERLRETVLSAGTLKVGSMFSGWGVLEMVLAELTTRWTACHSSAAFEARG